MTFSLKAGLAAAGLAFAAALPATAADLNGGGWGRGSIKDGAPVMAARPVGPCYYRADVGYSVSNGPHLRWNATDQGGNINETVTNTKLDSGWLAEAGMGCGSGSRGLRGEFMLGYHGDRDVSGTTAPFWTGANTINSRIVSSLQTYTAMFNAYYDLGNIRGFVPYVGAGVGLAYHRTDDYFLPNWASNPQDYRIRGDNDLALAWSLMTGAGYQISDRAIVDFGYRYIDFGKASTARNDNTGAAQVSRLHMDSLNAHEFKVGLRYHFGPAGECCNAAPAPLK